MRTIFVVLIAFAALGCDKSENKEADCERYNYGNIQFTFLSHQQTHKVEALTASGTIVAEKSFSAGIRGDTMRLPPGNYLINTYALPIGALPVLSQTDTISLTLCKDRLRIFVEW